MLSKEDAHKEIRCNQITIDMAYRLGKAKLNYNHLMMVVLCKLCDKDFISKIKKTTQKCLCWWRLSSRDTAKKTYSLAKLKSKLKYDRLILDGIEYGAEDLNNLPDDISTLSLCQSLFLDNIVHFPISTKQAVNMMDITLKPWNMLSSILRWSCLRMSKFWREY